MATLKDIQTKIAKLQAQAEAIARKESAGVIARIHALMDQYGLSVDDLGSRKTGKDSESKRGAGTAAQNSDASNAKYRDPKSGATWSGRGRAPGWIASAKNRNRFLIDSSATTASVADAKAKPRGNYVRGPQPPKYRDPKTGAEWSGRGKAPAWLASAKDRSKFMIDAASANGASAKKVSAKKAASGKAVAKKAGTTAKKSASKKASVKRAPVSESAQSGSASAAQTS